MRKPSQVASVRYQMLLGSWGSCCFQLGSEARRALHEATVEPGVLAKLARHAENPEITELVAEARRGVIEVFTAVGAAHYQIGRTYPWLDSLGAPGRALIRAVKAELDPKGRMNPGVLDL